MRIGSPISPRTIESFDDDEQVTAYLRANPAFPWIGVMEVRDSVLTIREGTGRPPTVLEIT